jgi:hypothetical protein
MIDAVVRTDYVFKLTWESVMKPNDETCRSLVVVLRYILPQLLQNIRAVFRELRARRSMSNPLT